MHRFDVPATVRLADVIRPAANEDEFGRLLRLARKAVIEGCDIRSLGRGQYAVSSSRNANVLYLVDTRAQSCTCPSTLVCSHLSLAVMTETASWFGDLDAAAIAA